MKTPIKKCSGINKAKGYNGCGKETAFRTYGLCASCFWDWMQTTELGKIHYTKSFIPKVDKKIEKEKKAKEIKLKSDFTNWRNKLQTKVQEIARLIDIGLPCLARGYHAGQLHGGHVYAKGGNKTIALNLHNIHRQSAQSNKWQNDDGLLRDGLATEYGMDYFGFVSELRKCQALHYSNMEYEQFYKKACKIANQLKKEGKRFDTLERIEMRNKVNSELGIYDDKFNIYILATHKQ